MKKVLVIDDKQDNLTSIKALIQNYLPDCKVITALSGQAGIELAGKELPDTILLDIIMPGMDGYAVCSELKKNAETKHIPVIIITAIKTDAESRIRGLENGADAFLSKPIDPSELAAQVNVMLRIKAVEDELKQEKRDLERIVSERTTELRNSYEDLKLEIEERKQAEEALKNSEKLLTLTLENISDPIFITDDNGDFTFICPNIKHSIGYSTEEIEEMGNISKFLENRGYTFEELRSQGKLSIVSIPSMINSE